jgi:hypothetical protein
MPGPTANVAPIVVLLIVGWRVYGRFRRSVGPQTVRRGRMMGRIAVYAVLILFFAVVSIEVVPNLRVLAGMLGGLALGAPLGVYGLHLTRFDKAGEAYMYTPNPYMGVGLSLLLVGRLAYRLIVLSDMAKQPQPHMPVMQSPLTLFIFGLLAGYYMTYFSGILVRTREK